MTKLSKLLKKLNRFIFPIREEKWVELDIIHVPEWVRRFERKNRLNYAGEYKVLKGKTFLYKIYFYDHHQYANPDRIRFYRKLRKNN